MDDLRAFIRERPRRLTIWLLVGGVMLHLALATSIGLSPDEAHYALYGAHLDWSYFDHPALVGWLQAPFVQAGGSDLAMRIVPMACWLVTAVLMCAVCRRLAASTTDGANRDDSARDDFSVVALLFLTPLLNLLGVVLVPDTLLMPLVPASMLATLGLRETGATKELHRWAVLGLLLGLCLLAKYTGVFIVLGALLTLSTFHGRALARLPGAWLCLLLIVMLASPIVIWNARHDWISFIYQSAHASGDQSWRLVSAARALALQALLFGVLLPMGVFQACRSGSSIGIDAERGRGDAHRMSLLFGVPVLSVFLVLSGRGSSLPHWTACGWVALIPLAVVGSRRLRRSVLVGVVAWQVVLVATIVALVVTGGPTSETGEASRSGAGLRLEASRPSPVADLYGWSAAATHGAALVTKFDARGLVVMNWSLASRLAWYARPSPVFVAPSRLDQFQLWFGSLRPGDSAIVIDWSGMPLPVPVGRGGFERCTPIDQLPTVEGGRQLAHFSYLLCQEWSYSKISTTARTGADEQLQK
ncbi:MAG: glycosyltransferase family 39 protein [Pseudomonadota bacterium]|nr:glycosyltransferase family 39 protein [Pseudomonadota bacterium]